MMYMVRYYIGLFRDDIDGQVPGNEPPEFIAEGIGAMCTIAMIPDRPMGAHHDHAIEKSNDQQINVKIAEQEDKKTSQQHEKPHPAKKGQPVLFVSEYIQPEKEF